MTTDTGDWERADRIFDAALDRPAGERGRFLDEACGGDGSLRARIERLLEEAETIDGFLTPGGALRRRGPRPRRRRRCRRSRATASAPSSAAAAWRSCTWRSARTASSSTRWR